MYFNLCYGGVETRDIYSLIAFLAVQSGGHTLLGCVLLQDHTLRYKAYLDLSLSASNRLRLRFGESLDVLLFIIFGLNIIFASMELPSILLNWSVRLYSLRFLREAYIEGTHASSPR